MKKISKNFYISLFAMGLFCLVVYLNFPGDEPAIEVRGKEINLSICTKEENQEECYLEHPRPRLNWICEQGGVSYTGDYSYEIQIDDNPMFDSPEVDTGEVFDNNSYYEVQSGLEFEKAYYWRIKAKNSAGEWSDWAEADNSFLTASACE